MNTRDITDDIRDLMKAGVTEDEIVAAMEDAYSPMLGCESCGYTGTYFNTLLGEYRPCIDCEKDK